MILSSRCTSFRMIWAYRATEAPSAAGLSGRAIRRANPPITVRGS